MTLTNIIFHSDLIFPRPFASLTSSLLGVKRKIPGKLGILALLVEGNGLMKHFFHKSSIKMIYNAKRCIYNDFLIITTQFEIIT